jgi:predicted nucleic acid-binding protein
LVRSLWLIHLKIAVIQEVKPLLDALIEQVGFWIDAQLYAEVLQAVGESA